jgi:CheY-like chemotaxis protein
MLRTRRILIVEDEPFIALDLVFAVEDAGGQPVGPAASVRQALALVEAGGIDAAILDVDLADGHSVPVLEALTARDVPVLIHTGIGLPQDSRESFPSVPVYSKPTPAAVLVAELAQLLAGASGARDGPP